MLKLKLFIILLFAAMASFYNEYHVGRFENTINIDGIGYNAYLPAIFLYHSDFNWGFTDSVIKKLPAYANHFQEFTNTLVGGDKVNKYSAGLAVTSLPFWLPALGYYAVTDIHPSGYEMPFQIAVWFNNIFWLFLGLVLFAVLLHEKGFGDNAISMVVFMLLFATNVFHFITFDNSLTHSVTLGISLICVYLIVKYNHSYNLYLFAFFAGLLVLIRPFNVLILPFYLFVLLQLPEWKKVFKLNKIVPVLLVFIAVVSLYFILIYLQTGKWFYYTYQNERFDFGAFHLDDILIGFECGLFVYTPIVLIAFWILFTCNFTMINKMLFFTYILFVFWLISCWGESCYGCRLGNRPIVDYYGVMLFPIIWLKPDKLSIKSKILYLPLVFVLYYNQILHYQYRHYIMDWCDMNKEKYMRIFLQTHK